MWDELGIAPTDDPKLIRRAYAGRLKRLDPDRERDAFARLRLAYERALAQANGDGRQPIEWPTRESPGDCEPDADVVIPHPGQARDSLPPSEPAALDGHPSQPESAFVDGPARERALLIELEAALRRYDGPEATKLYYRAAATGALPLGDAERVLARLFGVALEDPDRVAFRALARSCGWDKPAPANAAASHLRAVVLARLAAEDWYDSLVDRAERKKGTTRRQVKVARLMLRRIRRPGLLRIDRQVLASFIDEHKRHASWLRDRVDPAWMETLQARIRRREIVASVLIVLFVGGLLLQGVVVSTAALIKEGFSFTLVLFVGLAVILGWFVKHVVVELVRLLRRRT